MPVWRPTSAWLAGPTGEPSSLDIEVDVGAGGTLCWLPQPTVLIDGCDHTVTTTIRLGSGAPPRRHDDASSAGNDVRVSRVAIAEDVELVTALASSFTALTRVLPGSGFFAPGGRGTPLAMAEDAPITKMFDSMPRRELDGYARDFGIAGADGMSDTELRKRLKDVQG